MSIARKSARDTQKTSAQNDQETGIDVDCAEKCKNNQKHSGNKHGRRLREKVQKSAENKPKY